MQGRHLTVDTARDGEACYWSHRTIIHKGQVFVHSQYMWDNGYSMGLYRREYDYAAPDPKRRNANEANDPF